MYEHTIHILNSVVDHYKKMRSEEIEGYNKRGDTMGALGCAVAYEHIFNDIEDAIETLRLIADEMGKDEKETDDVWEEHSEVHEIKKSDKEENHEGKLQSD